MSYYIVNWYPEQADNVSSQNKAIRASYFGPFVILISQVLDSRSVMISVHVCRFSVLYSWQKVY